MSEQLQPITAVLNPDHTPSLQDLLIDTETCSKKLSQIEDGLKALSINIAMVSPEAAKGEFKVGSSVRTTARDGTSEHEGDTLKLPGASDGVRGVEGRRSVSPHSGTSSPGGLYDSLDNFGRTSPASPRVEYDQVCVHGSFGDIICLLIYLHIVCHYKYCSSTLLSLFVCNACMCTCLCMHVEIQLCTHAHTHPHIHTRTRTCTCTHIHAPHTVTRHTGPRLSH